MIYFVVLIFVVDGVGLVMVIKWFVFVVCKIWGEVFIGYIGLGVLNLIVLVLVILVLVFGFMMFE